MTENPTVERYLADLDRALRDVEPETARDIRSGIAEELRGLGPNAVGDRITQLGDPRAIAAAARSEVPMRDERAPVPAWTVPVTTLSIAFGGVIVPVVGWFVGIALLWTTRLWTRREKIAATLAPFVALLIVVMMAWFGTFGDGGTTVTYEFEAPSAAEFQVPPVYDFVWSGVLAAAVANVVAAAWLAFVGARRLARR